MGRKYGIGTFLAEADLLIAGATADSEIQKVLGGFNYGPERLAAVRSLLNEARDLTGQQAARYGEQHAATATVEELFSAADEAYKTTRRLARLLLGTDADAAQSLQLSGSRPRSMSGWLHQARIFYENLLASTRYTTALQEFGYTPEKLATERDQVLAVAQADAKQEDSKGASHASTTQRDAKLEELGKEISKLKALARITLTHEQQTKLGLTGRNASAGRPATAEQQTATEAAR